MKDQAPCKLTGCEDDFTHLVSMPRIEHSLYKKVQLLKMLMNWLLEKGYLLTILSIMKFNENIQSEKQYYIHFLFDFFYCHLDI